MKPYKFLLYTFFLLVIFGSTASAEAPVLAHPYHQSDWTQDEVRSLVDKYAVQYGVSKVVMHQVMNCESHYMYNIPGDKRNGIYESFGVSQIHLKDHPDITKQQALDADFSTEWMAKEMKAGRAYQWSCYKLLKLKV